MSEPIQSVQPMNERTFKTLHATGNFLSLIFYRFRVVGQKNVPEGGVLLCGNHSSNFDPILLTLALKTRDHPAFMSKIELFRVPLLGRLIASLGAYPIKRGAADLGAIKTTLRLLKEGNKVMLFPHGTRFRQGEDVAMKNGAAMLSLKAGVPILPFYLTEGRKIFINSIDIVFGKPFMPGKIGETREEQYANILAKIEHEMFALRPQTRQAKRGRKTQHTPKL